MVTTEIISRAFCQNSKRVKLLDFGELFPNFTSILFDYLLISWVTNYVPNRELLKLKLKLKLFIERCHGNFEISHVKL